MKLESTPRAAHPPTWRNKAKLIIPYHYDFQIGFAGAILPPNWRCCSFAYPQQRVCSDATSRQNWKTGGKKKKKQPLRRFMTSLCEGDNLLAALVSARNLHKYSTNKTRLRNCGTNWSNSSRIARKSIVR